MMKWSTFLGLVVNVDNDKIDKGWRYKDIDANKVDKWCLQKIRMMIMMNMITILFRIAIIMIMIIMIHYDGNEKVRLVCSCHLM